MRKYISPTTIIACLALFFSLTGAGMAATGGDAGPAGPTSIHHAPMGMAARIDPVRLELSSGQAAQRCTHRIPDSWVTALWVYANGRKLASPMENTARAADWAGGGTLVRVTAVPHDGPICVKAITWQSKARVYVRFRVLSPTGRR